MKIVNTLRKLQKYSGMLVLCVALGMAQSNIALGEAAPKIHASLSDSETVNISITAKTTKRSHTKIIVTRAIGESKKFVKFAQFKVSGNVALNIQDTVDGDTTAIAYKTRLSSSSNWSRVAKIKIPPKTGVTPTPKPTAVTTPQVTPTEVPGDGRSLPKVTLPSGASACPSLETQKIFVSVEAARKANGLGSLAEISELALSSQTFSAKMATTGNMSHDGWYENILQSGFRGSFAGQNIGYASQLSADLMFNAWMNSSGHRANILSPNFKYLGVGCVIDKAGLVWWTQDFGG